MRIALASIVKDTLFLSGGRGPILNQEPGREGTRPLTPDFLRQRGKDMRSFILALSLICVALPAAAQTEANSGAAPQVEIVELMGQPVAIDTGIRMEAERGWERARENLPPELTSGAITAGSEEEVYRRVVELRERYQAIFDEELAKSVKAYVAANPGAYNPEMILAETYGEFKGDTLAGVPNAARAQAAYKAYEALLYLETVLGEKYAPPEVRTPWPAETPQP